MHHTTGAKEKEVAPSALRLVQSMPIASALLKHDTESLGKIIQDSLPNPSTATVDSIVIEKSSGEAFTGGRSTPVYHVSCCVTRQQQQGRQVRKKRHFIVKLILMPSADQYDIGGDHDNEGSPAINLPDTPDYQNLWIKRESYSVERRFYDCAAPQIQGISPTSYSAVGSILHIPKLLASDRDGSRPWPAACFLMNDLRHSGFPRHPAFLSLRDVTKALRWLASFHARFWGEATSTSSWRRHLWHRGGFWTVKNRTDTTHNLQDGVKVAGLAQQWSQTARFLEIKHPSVVTAHTKGLGKRLEAASGPIADFLTHQCTSKTLSLGTLIHGDYKAANMFLADNNKEEDDNDDHNDNDEDASSVAVLDFQFAGLGLGAEDVAYILFPDARGHYFDSEAELLLVYHEELVSQLILQQKGGPSTLSLEAFRGHYELSRIDFVRYLLVEKGWVASTNGDARLISALETTMDRLDGGQLLSKNTYSEAAATFVSH